MAFEEIYNRLVISSKLLDWHRKDLNERRGFSDETIRKFRFVSGGRHMEAFEDEMLLAVKDGSMRESDLVASGAFMHDGKAMRINPVLLNERTKINSKESANVIIPYINLKGDVYVVRPHKLGLTGVPIEVYHEAALAGNPPEIVLTEGEFKAAAAVQYGIQALAVPGISSFSEKEWPRLMKMMNDHGVKKVTIMFDNETKDDPALPNYKDKPYDRYDTQFYAYYMAKKIETDMKIEVMIATLPEAWKVDGKIDIDGAAAQLRTQGEIKKVLYDALPRNDYLASLDPEAKQMVLRKVNQKFHRSKVKKEFNRYMVTRTRGQHAIEIPISNFVMRVIATHETMDGVKREVEFISEFGQRSGSFSIDAEHMSSNDAFRRFCLDKGGFIWRGSLEDLLTIWESEFLMMDEGRCIVESDHIGWLEKERLWLFGNVAIREDGTELRPDQNNIFWLDKRGIKPVPINIEKGSHSEGIPRMHLGVVDAQEILKRLGETIGHNEASVVMGWVAACAYMEEIFQTYRSFPFLFVTGRWQSGKSTIAEWVTNFFGIEEAGKSISQTTSVAIQRSLAYYSSLPVYLDEYRNTKDVAYKNGFLRNVYNRQGAGKGVKDSSYGLRDARVRGTLIIAGEETPKDGAVLSRCIIVFVAKAKRTKNHFSWFMTNRSRFSGHFLRLLKEKERMSVQFFDAITEWKEYFTSQGIDDRTALNYCAVVAGHSVVFGKKDVDFATWLTTETKTIQSEGQEEQAVSIFMDDLLALKTRRMVDDNYWLVDGNRIYVYFHGLHQVWSEQFRKSRGEESFKEASIRAYLKEEPGFLDVNVPYRIKGQVKKCIVFDYAKASDDIKGIVEGGL